jgi:hypothetical protein
LLAIGWGLAVFLWFFAPVFQEPRPTKDVAVSPSQSPEQTKTDERELIRIDSAFRVSV